LRSLREPLSPVSHGREVDHMNSRMFTADPEKNRVLYRQVIDLGRDAVRAGLETTRCVD
jgi:hypothetical protein